MNAVFLVINSKSKTPANEIGDVINFRQDIEHVTDVEKRVFDVVDSGVDVMTVLGALAAYSSGQQGTLPNPEGPPKPKNAFTIIAEGNTETGVAGVYYKY